MKTRLAVRLMLEARELLRILVLVISAALDSLSVQLIRLKTRIAVRLMVAARKLLRILVLVIPAALDSDSLDQPILCRKGKTREKY